MRFKRKKGGNKFGAIKTTIDGIRFDSKIESKHYIQLRDSDLVFEMQVTYTLQPSFKHEGKLIRAIQMRPDFVVKTPYETYVLDSKGQLTPEFKLKAKLLLHSHGVEIIPVTSMRAMDLVIDRIREANTPREIAQELDDIQKAMRAEKKLKKLNK